MNKVVSAKKYTYFVGIDVSRNELDFAIMQGHEVLFHREISNCSEAVLALIIEFKQLPKFRISSTLFCLEAAGDICNHVLAGLKKVKAHVAYENPLRIHKALGIARGKSDKADAVRIAMYAFRHQHELLLRKERRPIIDQIAELLILRKRVQSLGICLAVPLQEKQDFVPKVNYKLLNSHCKNSVAALKSDLKTINASLLELVRSDERLHRLMLLMTSIPGVGTIAALQVLVCSNEFKTYQTAKKFACYAGVAPFPRESGLMKEKTRVSWIANRRMKALLHTCALVAVKSDAELKAYFERKTQAEGKPKMKVYNAVRFKIISRIYSCVERDCFFVQGYRRNAEPDLSLVSESKAKRIRKPVLRIYES